MQPASTLVTVEEYLRTSFSDGDREYVDGRVLERNLGEKDHSRTQRKLIAFFVAQEAALGTYCFPEQRVQVKRTRFRVPDVCVYIGREPQEQVFEHAEPCFGEGFGTTGTHAFNELQRSLQGVRRTRHRTMRAWPLVTRMSTTWYGKTNGLERSTPSGCVSLRE